MSQRVVIEFDKEEPDQDQCVLGVYGPFESSKAAEQWAEDKWEKLGEEQQEFRGIECFEIRHPDTYGLD
jgi:hypothetical protein